MATNIIVKGGTARGKSNPIDWKMVNECAELNAAAPVRSGCGLRRRLPERAVMNAIRAEGPEVLGAGSESYWADCDRMFPQTRLRRESTSLAFGGFGPGRCRNALNPTGKRRIA